MGTRFNFVQFHQCIVKPSLVHLGGDFCPIYSQRNFCPPVFGIYQSSVEGASFREDICLILPERVIS